MSLISKIGPRIKPFYRNEKGNLTLATALSAVVVIGAVGAAVDYTRISSTKFRMSNALDAAVLATGVEYINGTREEEDLKAYFKKFYAANFADADRFTDSYRVANFSFDNETGEVKAGIEAELPSTFTGIFGYESFELNADATAKFDMGEVEIAMMLDVTGSMRGSKLRDLKLAASEAIDILLPNQNTKDVRVGLVPYSASVNAGVYAEDATEGNNSVQTAGLGPGLDPETRDYIRDNKDLTGYSRKCVTERIGVNQFTDAGPDPQLGGSPVGSHINALKNGGNCPANNEVIPLTNKVDTLKSEINRFQARGWTAGHLGIAWSYYLLSPHWDIWSSDRVAQPYDEKVQKIAILMTDGAFNREYTSTDSTDQAATLCDNMKALKDGAPGITIYSVAFQAPSSAQDTLRRCASENEKGNKLYFSAANGDELRTAFQSIAVSIQKLRVSR